MIVESRSLMNLENLVRSRPRSERNGLVRPRRGQTVPFFRQKSSCRKRRQLKANFTANAGFSAAVPTAVATDERKITVPRAAIKKNRGVCNVVQSRSQAQKDGKVS
jgi:hypothetical protein